MRNAELKISVVVVEESDLAGVNDEARVSGKMESIRRGIAEQFDRSLSVQVGMSEDSRRGSVPWVSIGGVRLRVGEAVAFLPSGVAKVDAPEDEKPVKKPVKKSVKKSGSVDADG